MKERKGKRRYPRPKIKRPRESSITAARSPLGKPSTVSSPRFRQAAPSLLEQRARVTPETNSVVHSTRRVLTGFEQRTASGALTNWESCEEKLPNSCRVMAVRLFFPFTAIYIWKCTRLAILPSLYLFIFLHFLEHIEVTEPFARSVLPTVTARPREFG